ncbi:MAG: type II toxin-antitoxin system VapB family antitoxin [Microcystis flos-aquae Mf_WU_F_19750830_S460]|uniref:Type II toxin-antitoxin system VapB family antitoxin n=1 Tax=Microcystis flos-aquae Mf_WU_F_19750830_S460 TaxID=2486237 RepID=A0A552LEX2_9CHRO|nr:MAG: type II toxin-antitoxin system VapB family antitoxin [Microcystis flos-aquae Mf_WU_F_19750830_S460]
MFSYQLSVISEQLSVISEQLSGLFSTLCDKFNLHSSDRSLCPLCLCGSFHSLACKTVS